MAILGQCGEGNIGNVLDVDEGFADSADLVPIRIGRAALFSRSAMRRPVFPVPPRTRTLSFL
jgi:hypothetical protein